MIQEQKIRFKLLRDNAEYGELYAGSAPTLRNNSSGEIKLSLQGTFLPNGYDTNGNIVEIDWLYDEIQPVLTINGVEEPLGILMPAKVTPSKNGNEETIDIQAYDRCWRVQDTKVEGGIYISAGSSYIDIIEGLLVSCGIGTIMKVPSVAVFAEAREDWQTGTSYLKIVNQLLQEINYKQLWFDSRGIARLEPASVPTVENVQHIFTNQKIDPRNPKEVQAHSVMPTISRETDIFNAPNVFVCICSNADKDNPMTATAENTNPMSPLSIMRRGRRIVQVENVDNVASQEDLQAYANKLLNDSMITGETIKIKTGLLQGFGTDDVSALRFDDTVGICIEKAWEMQLAIGGEMTHTLEKVVINLE